MTPALSRAVLVHLPAAGAAVAKQQRSSLPSSNFWRGVGAARAWRGASGVGGVKGTRGLCAGGVATQTAEPEDQQVKNQNMLKNE